MIASLNILVTMAMERSLPASLIILLLTLAGPSSVVAAVGPPGSASGLLEPVVNRFSGVLPESVCRELIALGEAEGFTVDEESIDADVDAAYRVSSQSIEVYEQHARREGVISAPIWGALEPWIPTLTELVKKSIDKTTDAEYFPDKPDRTPQLGWVFFRKYSPDSDRKSLKLHVDSNMHTLNIALNHDFEGGGLFYVRPPAGQDPEDFPDHRPDIPIEYQNYDWLDRLQRGNTSDIVFPALEGGDVLVHNFTVWHAVAPIERGTRYSFVLFYDMDNPAVKEDFEEDDYEPDEDSVPVEFYHEIRDLEIDLAYVDGYAGAEGGEDLVIMEEGMPPFMSVELDSYEGHVFLGLVSGTREVVSEFVVSRDQQRYVIEREGVVGPEDDRGDEL